MTWGNALNYAKKVVGVDNKPRADDGLPYGARIGSLVQWQVTPFIRAELNGSLIKAPSESSGIICSISRMNIDIDGKLYRFYLQTGDSDDNEVFIQVYVDSEGAPIEALYCHTLTRIIPETIEEQIAYTGTEGYGLGEQTYGLSKGNLYDLGFSQSMIEGLVMGDGELLYTRLVDSGNAAFMTPLEGIEQRIDDAKGLNGIKQKVHFMPYYRNVGDIDEYLLISTEILESKDGDTSERSIHVDFMLGLPLELDRLIVQ